MRVLSEGPVRITKTTIDAAWRRRVPDQRLIVRDKDCRGLALIVNPTTMTWSYAYRPRGTDPLTERRWPNRTVTLGNPETHSPDDARAAANHIKGQAKAGADPAAEKRAKAEAERRKRGATLQRLADEYAKALPKRPKLRGTGTVSPDYVAEELAQVRMALADMGAEGTPAADLTAADVRRLLAKRGEDANPRARFGALSRFLDWCQDAGHIQANPCALIVRSRRPKAPQARAHYLTPVELARLWHAAERLGESIWRDLVRFLIAVPCRRGEAAHLDWSHIDLAAAEWRQPGKLTKNRDPHRLHLHPLALDVLKARHQAAGQPRSGLVFPAPVSRQPVDTFTDLKAALVEATKPKDGEDAQVGDLTGWTWHDFRRSFATALGEAGIPETVADAVLNHRQAATRGGVLGVYQRSTRWPEQVKAMEWWGRLLAAAINGKDASEGVVVPMRGATAGT
ncbi:MAG: tyrosine-type recombinase/integrase [Rhodospirillales bacterium]|nr:tyrosine-type recombinase/integrase [Rhodospirillales bacterium]